MGWMLRRKLGGCTGDGCGAVCEIAELLCPAAVAVPVHLRMP